MSDYEGRDRFDVRTINLVKLTKVIDFDIVIAEADFCIADIDRQINEGWGDQRWLADAKRARGEIEHKKRLATLKRAAIVDAQPSPAQQEQDNFRTRFYRAAAAGLDEATFNRISEAAKFVKEAA